MIHPGKRHQTGRRQHTTLGRDLRAIILPGVTLLRRPGVRVGCRARSGVDRWRRRSRAGSTSTSRIQFRIGSRTGNRRRRRARRASCRWCSTTPVLGDGAVRRPDRDPEHQPDRAARSHVHELPHDLARLDPGKRGGPALPAWKAAAGSSDPSACADTSVSWVPCLAAPSGTWRARSWLRRPRPSAGGIVAATCGRAGRLVRAGGLGLQLAPDTYLPSKTEYASAPIICVNGSRAKAARAATPVKEPITQRHRKESLHVPDRRICRIVRAAGNVAASRRTTGYGCRRRGGRWMCREPSGTFSG
jgi:putative intracellular protease/amidase